MSKYIWLVLAWLTTMIVMIPITYCYTIVKYSTIEQLLHTLEILLTVYSGAIVFFPTGVFVVLGINMFIEGRYK